MLPWGSVMLARLALVLGLAGVPVGCGGQTVPSDAGASADQGGASDAPAGGDSAECLGTENRNDSGQLCETTYDSIPCECFDDSNYGVCTCHNGVGEIFYGCPCCPSLSQAVSMCARDM